MITGSDCSKVAIENYTDSSTQLTVMFNILAKVHETILFGFQAKQWKLLLTIFRRTYFQNHIANVGFTHSTNCLMDLVCTTPPTVHANSFETSHVFWSWSEDVHVTWI